MPDPIRIPAATNCSIGLNRFSSNVAIRVETDEGGLVMDERVLLLHGDDCSADVYQMQTDDQGEVQFLGLPIRPTQFVYIILPDVLEAWSRTPVREIWESAAGQLDAEEDPGEEVPEQGDSDEQDVAHHNITTFQNFSKDAIDKLHKVRVYPGDSNSAPLIGNALAKLNRKFQRRRNYRTLDCTKYATSTDAAEDQFKTIKLNRLTESEKFEHHLKAYTLNRGGYTGVGAGANKYDPRERLWRIKNGAVCNGFINVFLGYWYNMNAAFTVQCKNESFIKMMEKSADKSRRRRYRGFSHVVEPALEAPAGVRTRRYKAYEWVSIHTSAPTPAIPHLRLEDPSSVDPLATAGYRFIYGGDPSASPTEFDDGLHTYNIYSKSSDKRNNGKVIMDHHGGVMIRSDDGEISTLAADGYKRSRGNYSMDLIHEKTPSGLLRARSVHLRIWPLQSLRAGGFPPAEAGATQYKPEADFGSEDTLDSAFRQSLPRFILWR